MASTRTTSRRPTTRTNTVPALALGLVLTGPLMAVYGATLAKLWEWFVADTFGVLALSTAQAIGLSMVVTFVTYQEDAAQHEDDALSALVSRVVTSLVRAGLALFFGAIVKGFIGG